MWIGLIYLLFAFHCIIFESLSSQNEASLDSKWRNANSINTFQQITKKYPFLMQNIKIEKIINLIDQGICQFNQGDLGRFLILDNQVYLYGGKKAYQKNQHYQKYLQEILKVRKVPDVYFIIHINNSQFHKIGNQQAFDRCRFLPMFTFNKSLSNDASNTKFLLPNINILIGQWQSKIKQIKKLSFSHPWKDKISKLFYRGTCNISLQYQQKNITLPIKQQLVLQQCQRCGYVMMSNQHPDMVDAKLTTKCMPNQFLTNFLIKKYGQKKLYGNYLQLRQQIKYKYLLYADAQPNSWNQAASFLFSNSIIFIPYSQNIQWFYQYLIPNKNYILINNNSSDILKKMKQLQKSQIKAMQIIKNGNTLAEKYLTSEAIGNFTTNLIKKYAKVQKLTLKQNQKNDIKKGIDAQLVLKLKQMRQKWENLSQLVIFQKILCRFTQLQQNFEIKNLLQKSNNCSLHLARFIILDNQLYCQGKYCLNQIAKNISRLIKRALSQYIIPDSYFLIRIDQENLDENIPQSCRNLPYFIFNKDPQFQEQKNKFLFPHPDTQQFKDQIKQFVKKINNIDWAQKQNKMFFGGTFHYNQDLSSLSLFAKSLLSLPYLKKEYFQARIQNSFQKNKQVKIQTKNINIPSSQGINTKNRKSQILAMMSKSIVLSHKIKKLSWLDQFVIPGKHYVQINDNLSNLKNTIQLLIENDQKAKQMCDESFILSLTKFQDNVIQTYIAQVLKNYSQIQKLKLIQIQKKKILKGKAFIQAIRTVQQQLFFQTILIVITFFVLLYYAYLVIRKLQISSVDENITTQQINKEEDLQS